MLALHDLDAALLEHKYQLSLRSWKLWQGLTTDHSPELFPTATMERRNVTRGCAGSCRECRAQSPIPGQTPLCRRQGGFSWAISHQRRGWAAAGGKRATSNCTLIAHCPAAIRSPWGLLVQGSCFAVAPLLTASWWCPSSGCEGEEAFGHDCRFLILEIIADSARVSGLKLTPVC